MTDDEINEVRAYFERTYDGNKVIPIIDELIRLREFVHDYICEPDYRICGNCNE